MKSNRKQQRMLAAFMLSLLTLSVASAKNDEDKEDKGHGKPERVIELQNSIEVRKESFREAKEEDDKEKRKEMHEEARESFWDEVKSIMGRDGHEEGDHDDDDDREAELEVEIEINGGVARVKVEQADDKSRFELETTNIDEIVAEIATRFGLDEAEVRRVMELEIEDADEDDSSDQDDDQNDDSPNDDSSSDMLEIEVEIENGSTQVKIEQNGTLTTYTLAETDTDAIVAEIATRLGMSETEVRAVMQLEVKDSEDTANDASDDDSVNDDSQNDDSSDQDDDQNDDSLNEDSSNDMLEIEVEIENGSTQVKIEQNGTLTTYTLAETDTDAIVAEIATRLGMSETEVRAVMQLEVKDSEDTANDASDDDSVNDDDDSQSEEADNDTTAEDDSDEVDDSDTMTDDERMAEAQNIIERALAALARLFR